MRRRALCSVLGLAGLGLAITTLLGCPVQSSDDCEALGNCGDTGDTTTSSTTDSTTTSLPEKCVTFAAGDVVDAGCGLFVSPAAGSDDEGDGSRDKPFATLSKALLAPAAGAIYVCEGKLTEALTITGDAHLLGGFECAGWSYTATKPQVEAPPDAPPSPSKTAPSSTPPTSPSPRSRRSPPAPPPSASSSKPPPSSTSPASISPSAPVPPASPAIRWRASHRAAAKAPTAAPAHRRRRPRRQPRPQRVRRELVTDGGQGGNGSSTTNGGDGSASLPAGGMGGLGVKGASTCMGGGVSGPGGPALSGAGAGEADSGTLHHRWLLRRPGAPGEAGKPATAAEAAAGKSLQRRHCGPQRRWRRRGRLRWRSRRRRRRRRLQHRHPRLPGEVPHLRRRDPHPRWRRRRGRRRRRPARRPGRRRRQGRRRGRVRRRHRRQQSTGGAGGGGRGSRSIGLAFTHIPSRRRPHDRPRPARRRRQRRLQRRP
ncbi:MAG: hypothetical protein R3F14_27750 [Polyangiaceae bacterium]